MRNPIPLFTPSCSDKEIENITKSLRSGWWGLGPRVSEFEKRFADFVGTKYAVGLDSCTNSLILALDALNIHGGEVIVPALTFVSTALAAVRNNNKVVFADIDEKTLCIDWNDVKNKMNKNTKAIIPVWYGGRVNDIPELDDMLHPNFGNIEIIEDCAHAVGNKEAGKNTGCWSFHAVKNLATGDGGMVTTNDEKVRDRLLAMRWCGIDKSTWDRSQKKYGWDYDINMLGYKAHMNDLAASIGLAQLDRIDELNNKRKLRVLQYLYELANIKWLRVPEYDTESSWHLFVVRLEERNRFIDYMLAHGISIGVHYKPLNKYSIFPDTKLPVTDRVWETLATLPLYADMTDEEFNYIVSTIKKFK